MERKTFGPQVSKDEGVKLTKKKSAENEEVSTQS